MEYVTGQPLYPDPVLIPGTATPVVYGSFPDSGNVLQQARAHGTASVLRDANNNVSLIQ